jgi:hypothetical protein
VCNRKHRFAASATIPAFLNLSPLAFSLASSSDLADPQIPRERQIPRRRQSRTLAAAAGRLTNEPRQHRGHLRSEADHIRDRQLLADRLGQLVRRSRLAGTAARDAEVPPLGRAL